jgi:hypothetical protein
MVVTEAKNEKLGPEALGMEVPEEVLGRLRWLRNWGNEHGQKAQAALFCAFHPWLADIDLRERERAEGGVGFNPTGIEDVDLVRARLALIQLRDAFLTATLWNPEYTVLFTHAIEALGAILRDAIVSGCDTDGVGPETG